MPSLDELPADQIIALRYKPGQAPRVTLLERAASVFWGGHIVVFVGLLGALRVFFPAAGYYVSLGLTAVFILIYGFARTVYLPWLQKRGDTFRWAWYTHGAGHRYISIFLLFATVCLVVAMSSRVGVTARGFTGDVGRAGEWVLFVLDALLKVILLDTMDIFGIRLSSIAPATFATRTMSYLLNLCITAGVIETLVTQRATRARTEYVGTRDEVLGQMSYHPVSGDVELAGRMEPPAAPTEFPGAEGTGT